MARRSKNERFGIVPAGVQRDAEVADITGALQTEGAKPASPGYWKQAVVAGQKFEGWLTDVLGISLEEMKSLSPTNQYGEPVFSSYFAARWISDVAAGGKQNPETLKDYVRTLAVRLKPDGWDVTLLESNTTQGKELRALCANLGVHKPKRQARAILVSDLDALIDAIDENRVGWVPLFQMGFRTFALLCSNTGLRGGECVYKLLWSHIDLENNRLVIPAGLLKWSNDELIIPLVHRPECGAHCVDRCASNQLHIWKAMSAAAGANTQDGLAFPAVRSRPYAVSKGCSAESSEAYWGDRVLIADPISEDIANALAQDPNADEVVALAFAQHKQYKRWDNPWRRLAEEIGWKGRDLWEGIGLHGFRRGMVHELRDGDVHPEIISMRCGHKNQSTTSVYYDRQLPDTTPLFNALPEVTLTDVELKPDLFENPGNGR